jgi:hypothetical protein
MQFLPWRKSSASGWAKYGSLCGRRIPALAKNAKDGARGEGREKWGTRMKVRLIRLGGEEVKIPTLPQRTRQGWGTPAC